VRALRASATIARNELLRTTRDRTVVLFALLLPVLVTIVVGSTFEIGEDRAINVGAAGGDGGAAADLVAAVDEVDRFDVVTYDDVGDLRRDVRSGSLSVGLVVPDDYDARLAAGDDVTVDIVADPASANVATVQAALDGAIAQRAERLAAARTAVEHGAPDADDALATADRLADQLPRTEVRTETVRLRGDDDGGTGGSGDDEDGDGSDGEDSAFAYPAPANLVLFVFVNTVAVGSVLADDRSKGLTRRLLATPHGTGVILAGIGAARLAFALVQSALIVVIGALAFGVGWGDPLAAALLVVLFAVVSTAVGLLVGATVSSSDQAQSIAVPLSIAAGMLGGCMWPLFIVPDVMRTVGHVVPHAWAMDAWIDLVLDGDPLGDVAVSLIVLTGYAVVLGVLAAWRLRVVLTR
jgi:ABC-2 type transport system permease protein